MTTVSKSSKLDSCKLETIFDGEDIIHTTYKTELATQQRRVRVKTRWTEKKRLGCGAFGIVSLQESERGQLRAVKSLRQGFGLDYSHELRALSKLTDREDLFVLFLGWYENRNFIFIAMEYIEHGDLNQYLNTLDARPNAREITRQLLEGLAVLHERKICHRDLKPQNILIASLSPIWVKIADFGGSKREKGTELHTQVGTHGYTAPEIFRGLLPGVSTRKYSNAVDMWALGCIVHKILTSQIPFLQNICTWDTVLSGVVTDIKVPDSDQMDLGILLRFCCGQMEFPVESLRQSEASYNCICFVKGLLVANPDQRMSAREALGSPWIKEDSEIHKDYLDHHNMLTSSKDEINKAMELKKKPLGDLAVKPGAWSGQAVNGSPEALQPPVVVAQVTTLESSTLDRSTIPNPQDGSPPTGVSDEPLYPNLKQVVGGQEEEGNVEECPTLAQPDEAMLTGGSNIGHAIAMDQPVTGSSPVVEGKKKDPHVVDMGASRLRGPRAQSGYTATDPSRTTDHTSYTIPEDGREITIKTNRRRKKDADASAALSGTNASLLIEYFENSKPNGGLPGRRPGVRVKATPSTKKRHRVKSSSDRNDMNISSVGTSPRSISLSPHVGEDRLVMGDPQDNWSTSGNLSRTTSYDSFDVSIIRGATSLGSVESSPGEMNEPYNRRTVPRKLSAERGKKSDTFVQDPMEYGTQLSGLKTRRLGRRRSRSLSPERVPSRVLSQDEKGVEHNVIEGLEELRKKRNAKSRKGSQSRTGGMKAPRPRSRSRSCDREVGDTTAKKGRQRRKESQMEESQLEKTTTNNLELLDLVEDAIQRLILPQLNELKKGGDQAKLPKFDQTIASTLLDRQASKKLEHRRMGSGNSHGMPPPLYDSGTGSGVDRIQSKDNVVLINDITRPRDPLFQTLQSVAPRTLLPSTTRTEVDKMGPGVALGLMGEFQDMRLRTFSNSYEPSVSGSPGGSEMPGIYYQEKPPPEIDLGSSPVLRESYPRTEKNYLDEHPPKRLNVFKRAMKGLGIKSSQDLGRNQ